MKQIFPSLRALAVFTVLTGGLYPLFLTGLGQAFFPSQANGSLITRNGVIVGSELIAQKLESPRYFQPRPSAGDFATVASGASNLAPTSTALKAALETRRSAWGAEAPADLLFSSGSGLDPHISPEAAAFQLSGLVQARQLAPSQATALRGLVSELVEAPTFGILGQSRVNVLKLNLRLDDEIR